MFVVVPPPKIPNRAKIFQDVERLIHPSDIMDKVVYDLDLQRSVVFNAVTVSPNMFKNSLKSKKYSLFNAVN